MLLQIALVKNLTVMQNQGENFYASDLLRVDDSFEEESEFNLTNLKPNTKQGSYRNTTLIIQNPFFTLYSTENPDSMDFVFSTVVLADNNVWGGFAFSNDNQMVK